MNMHRKFEIFLVVSPGLELALRDEALDLGFRKAKATEGGVRFRGNWADVWRANLMLRGAARVLARIGSFKVTHLAQLDTLSREFAWHEILRPDIPVRVDVTCKKSRIYHAGAAAERIERAITQELGAPISSEAQVCIKVRIEDDLCTLSVDTSGELLHKRGHKEAVGKAPMRENMAALFLRQCGYDGTEPVLDPMCGSGTFVIEAAEIAAGLLPGRSRHFAFEDLATFDAETWADLQEQSEPNAVSVQFYGSDRDAGAIRNSRANAERAGITALTQFNEHSAGEISPPKGPKGLVIVNPPYGGRIGDKKHLFALHGSLGKALLSRFSGWRVGIITNEPSLAKATALPFKPLAAPVAHGGLKVRLYQTDPLP
ncbi:class I SAM-dependent RNA methyltransferase [Phaeobacter gallaeciensis]|uniref:Class I SAM-dependent RNA methyltransferase n=2 Tax=Roseobacteraceae TaxID=2854170 RepID=A0A366WL17_9RHOB|nr:MULTISPECIES: class I SAM-dependent RNA methyltransferase [Roseobacteraceae]MBT3139797.1 class I SAM-dependent RNA methyltransferase [Falsiruegeria litorea]MBT8167036.1 class I SAM-dependent RNA methyltransferase [Falsiruegeria litorea]RBW49611.1 class I SAM-dependent RNA methyltransferase [Phaeobacter gallaeciensis]